MGRGGLSLPAGSRQGVVSRRRPQDGRTEDSLLAATSFMDGGVTAACWVAGRTTARARVGHATAGDSDQAMRLSRAWEIPLCAPNALLFPDPSAIAPTVIASDWAEPKQLRKSKRLKE